MLPDTVKSQSSNEIYDCYVRCCLEWTRDAQTAGSTLFLHVSVRMSLEGISIQISRLKKVILTVWVGTAQSTEGLQGNRRAENG